MAPGPLVEQSMDNIKHTFDTNIFAILRICKAVVPSRHSITRAPSTLVQWHRRRNLNWNALYCASKAAAAHSISEGLSMELKPFNISVLHVAPAAVKSNISSNAINPSRFALQYPLLQLPFIIRRIYYSQGPNSMPTKDFAQQTVPDALRSREESSEVYVDW